MGKRELASSMRHLEYKRCNFVATARNARAWIRELGPVTALSKETLKYMGNLTDHLGPCIIERVNSV